MIAISSSATPSDTQPPPTQEVGYEVFRKWGAAAKGGFQAIPDTLIKYQERLGLTPLDVVVLLNITMHWWRADDLPFPSAALIAKRIGIGRRSVERRLAQLQKKG